ncbi:flagellar motor protein MotB [Planctomycetes bacterium K23_9]|uniref:Flagellar motor protein MotD n=1 Tax=Stieleria marina TaxID=1930275 RepID=A0A517NVK5_9BACT|nr:flagellar motor protein MotD [Planctomycetes bacterium K23_9]
MGKRKKIEPSMPSKAYLVSFGDTMTALLAFFIVLNSLAKEQTGANMYSGTGSFVKAFSSSGMPGHMPGKRSSDMIQQVSQKPIYALAENLEKNQDQAGNVGPDDSDKKDRVKDRDKENFQKFLEEMEKTIGLKTNSPLTGQVVFDSFEPFDPDTGDMSRHAMELLSESISKLRQPDMRIEIIVWASVPSQTGLQRSLSKSVALRGQVEKLFWVKPEDRGRINHRTKPWLFSDAKRPTLSVVMSKIDTSP